LRFNRSLNFIEHAVVLPIGTELPRDTLAKLRSILNSLRNYASAKALLRHSGNKTAEAYVKNDQFIPQTLRIYGIMSNIRCA
jgi:hypothetical protein